jgi:putative resolvase
MKYLPSRKASELLNVHPNTLRSWAKQGKIDHIVTETGQRRYNISKLLGKPANYTGVCYCRVSSPKQRDDLERQVECLRSHYPNYEIIKDMGSTLNGKRKGLRSLLEKVLAGDKLEVVVVHRSCLARFNFDLLEWLIEQNGGRIVVLNQTVYDYEAELTADLLTLLHNFSCRMPGSGPRQPPTPDSPLSEASAETSMAILMKCVKNCLLQSSRTVQESREENQADEDTSVFEYN